MLLLSAPVLGASGVAAALARPGIAAANPPAPGFVSAADLGIAPTNSAASNRANLVAALSNSAVCVAFPPGDYQLDNSASGVQVNGYGGEFVMLPGARLVFTDNTQSGLVFEGGTGARLSGLTSTFATMPTVRNSPQECILFRSTTDSYLEDVRIDGSAAAGLLFWRCVRPMVVDAVISNTMADGLHFANCQDGRADHITTIDTGDDGVSFVNYDSGPDNTGGLVTNVSVTRSKSRGVNVGGQSGVTIRDVVVNTTVGHGMYCAYDPAWNTRTPSDVRFERARVVQGGAWTAAPGGGTNSGIRVSSAENVTVAEATVDAPGTNGIYASGSTVTISGATVKNAPGSGCNLQGGAHQVDRLSVDHANGIGFTVSNADRVEYGTVTVRNAAITHATHRAVNIENNTYVFGGRLWIYDTQSTATGYVVGAYGSQRGSLGAVGDLIGSRSVTIDNPSGLAYTTF
ncbi:right-handed parallel beta-helix repeat-containing protein [Dactylosporangium sp. NPDC049140]|uniref:right-handed parallel beta-helix repeat-containing protein n=1 Tax=Dactylosporangium sp. NPDC049140 TaxID=3155647 RepID=UPI003409EF80